MDKNGSSYVINDPQYDDREEIDRLKKLTRKNKKQEGGQIKVNQTGSDEIL